MLKISAPYIRETAVRDDKEGKNIVLHIVPPGTTINFRLRYGRQTWSLAVKDAYHAARYTANPEPRQDRPKIQAPASVKGEILNLLTAHGSLNIAQVLQLLRKKRMNVDKSQVGEWLDTLKEMKKVKQEKFNYQIIK